MGGNPRLNKNENLFALFKKTKILFSFKKKQNLFMCFLKLKTKRQKNLTHMNHILFTKKQKIKKSHAPLLNRKSKMTFSFHLEKYRIILHNKSSYTIRFALRVLSPKLFFKRDSTIPNKKCV